MCFLLKSNFTRKATVCLLSFISICAESNAVGMVIFMKERTKFALTGALAGAANGFFGAGGGLFLVPLLVSWCGMEQRKAFATSVAVILPLCAVSAAVYWMKGGLDIGAAWPYLLGGAAGGVIAGRIFQKVSMVWLRRAFGLLILYGGVRAVLLL